MKRNIITGGIVLLVVVAGVYVFTTGSSKPALVQDAQATVLYDPTCGCCGNHAAYLERSGFQVERERVLDISAVKAEYGIPQDLRSCHTTLVEGYVVEGHMPVEAIAKLLKERPNIKGIALPGMPQGSPGMGGNKIETWTVYALAKDGSYSVFMEM